ncbi:hypothetical protein WAE58_22135 [Pedobacter panaciterrae]|uniref:Uncharacterized protein n=1 Tax=Pedobacter panaciterrae TaxID=363849 RepID=A0ABU8NU60_9SPHI
MNKSTVLFRNTTALILLLAGIYLSISAIIALPLLEEEAGYKKDEYYKLNERIDEQMKPTLAYLNDISIDSNTKLKFDSISVLLGNTNRSETIDARFNMNKRNVMESIKDQAEHCKQLYENTGVLGKIKKDAYASKIVLNYSELCNETKQEVFKKYQGALIQISRLYAIALKDKSPNHQITRKENLKLDDLFLAFVPKEVREPLQMKNSGMGAFFPARWAMDAQSQNIAIIIGLVGFALFGAVLGAFSKPGFNNVNIDNIRTDGLIYYEILVVLVRGFSAALVVYLSLKGGLSLITTTSSDKINPYVILFLCFISAVFSDNIWEWAKTKLVSSDPKKDPNDPNDPNGNTGVSVGNTDPESSGGGADIGAEIPAELPIAPGAIADQPAAVPPAADIPEAILQEAIAAKYPEWKETFSLLDGIIGKKVLADQREVNAIVFKTDKIHLDDPLYCAELPTTITYVAQDNQTYNIPIDILAV